MAAGRALRTADSEGLLHDGQHVLPYLLPVNNPLLSSSAAAASAISISTRFGIRRLTPSIHALGGIGAVAVPPQPFNASSHAKSAVTEWMQTRADAEEFASAGPQLLTECLEADAALARRRRRFDPYAGNALCVLGDGCDGASFPHLLHVQGEHMDTLALRNPRGGTEALCTCTLPRSTIKWDDREFDEPRHRLLQLTACASDDASSGPRRIAARSTDWIHHFLLDTSTDDSSEDVATGGGGEGGGAPRLRHVASTGNLFTRRPLDIALNPAIQSESAVLLDDGYLKMLNLDRIHAPPELLALPTSSSGASTAAAAPPPTHYFQRADAGSIQLHNGTTSDSVGTGLILEEPWGSVEYAEHPRVLYLASGAGLYQTDLRVSENQPVLVFDARTLPLPELRAGSMATPRSGRLLSRLAGSGNGGVTSHHHSHHQEPLIAIASSEQLVVIDVRHAHTPLHQVRLPLPLPATRKGEQAPMPRYSVEFAPCNDALLLVEMTSARPLLVPLPTSQQQGEDTADGSYLQRHTPRPSMIPISLDPDNILSRRAALLEAHAASSTLPLAGAAIFPLPRDASFAHEEEDRAAVASWAVASLSARGEVELLCEDQASAQTHNGAAIMAGAISKDSAAPTARRAEWEPQIVGKRDQRRDAALDEFYVVNEKAVEKVRTQLLQGPSEAAPAAAVVASSSTAPAARLVAPFTAREDDDPLIGEMASQWGKWAEAEGGKAAAAASNITPRISQRRRDAALPSSAGRISAPKEKEETPASNPFKLGGSASKRQRRGGAGF